MGHCWGREWQHNCGNVIPMGSDGSGHMILLRIINFKQKSPWEEVLEVRGKLFSSPAPFPILGCSGNRRCSCRSHPLEAIWGQRPAGWCWQMSWDGVGGVHINTLNQWSIPRRTSPLCSCIKPGEFKQFECFSFFSPKVKSEMIR